MTLPRHSRQVRLPEIGEEGQARIAATTAVIVSGGLAGAVEARYLAGAGVARIATLDQAISDAALHVDPTLEIVPEARVRLGTGEPPDFEIKNDAAREVALGAWRALAHLRRAVLRRASERP
jgi:hypothetical protein